MVTIGPLNKTSPFVQFWLDAYLYDQDWASNWSRVAVNIRAINTGNTTSNFGGPGQQIGSIDGVANVVVHSGTPFLPGGVGSGVQRWSDTGVSPPIAHDANGNLTVTARLTVTYGSINETYTVALSLPRIPKPPTAPGTPDASAIMPTSMTLSWTGSADNRGAPIDHYLLRRHTNPNPEAPGYTDYLVAGLSNAVSGLTPGTEYSFCVYAHNAAGYSPRSGIRTVRTLSGLAVGKGGSFVPAEFLVGRGGVFVPVADLRVGKGGSFVPTG